MDEDISLIPPGPWGIPVDPEETTAPEEETTAPDGETTAPEEETTAPDGETTAPEEETTEATEETTAPEEETTAATEAPIIPTGETTVFTGETTAVDPEPAAPCNHGWCIAAICFLAVLSLALLAAVIVQALRLRRRRKASAVPLPVRASAPPSGAIRVGKLHCQGDRESQQDCMAVSPLELYGTQGVLAVVADGMGGLADGDRMSQAAASAMLEGFLENREQDPLLALTARANQTVNTLLGPEQLGASGTTLVAGIARDGLFRYVSVGDSRICLYRQGSLIQLNREHVYRNELIVRAVNGVGTLWDAQTHPKAGGLTSYLGMGELKYVDIPAEPLHLMAGDRIVLMSDGVYNALTLEELESALGLEAQQAADTIARMIQAKAYRNQDNYTAVILEF